jgi:hypothetical protein
MINEELFQACSVFGLYQLLRALNMKGLTATQLTRESGLRSYQQIRKYLRLALGMRLIFDYVAPLGGIADSSFARVFRITDEGRILLRDLGSFDDSRAIHKGMWSPAGKTITISDSKIGNEPMSDVLRKSKIP